MFFGRAGVEQVLTPIFVEERLSLRVVQDQFGVVAQPSVVVLGLGLKPVDVADVVEPRCRLFLAVARNHSDTLGRRVGAS